MTEHKKQGLRSHLIVWPLLVSSGLSIVLYACRVLAAGNGRYLFMLWNLFLAWVPLALSVWLVNRLPKTRWASWRNILITVLWLGFLPNSFYLVTDFIHLKSTGEVSLLFDAVMFMTFAWNGLLLGFVSTLLVHKELLVRLRQRMAAQLIGATFILCSFAIYLGRYLAWNTWDIIINPAGLLFDVSDRLVRPASYPSTITTTALFSVVIGTLYWVVYKLLAAIRGEHSRTN